MDLTEEYYDKILTEKQFRDIVTPFIKAYKKKVGGELALYDQLIIGDRMIGASVYRGAENFILFCDIYVMVGENDDDWEQIGKDHDIESNGNTTTEIVDFLAYEYSREMKKIKRG